MRECTKIKYGSRELGIAALARGKQGGIYQPSHQVYYCLECNHFHIGRSRTKEQHRRERAYMEHRQSHV